MPKSGKTPTKVKIKIERETHVSIDGNMEYNLYVKGNEYKELPNDANIREPEDKSKPYKDMYNTLITEPEKFFLNNLGISVLASDVKDLGRGYYELAFKDETGIMNGGHTQRAILDAQNDAADLTNAMVKITVTVANLDADRIAEIALCKNKATLPKDFSLDDKIGRFDKLKKALDSTHEQHIRWYENKNVGGVGIDADEVIRILNLFDILKYSSDYSTGIRAEPNVSFSSKNKAYNEWAENPETTEIIYPLVNDILDFYETVQMRSCDRTNLARLDIFKKGGKELPFSGDTPDYVTPNAFLFPFIAAFRANVFYDSAKKEVGWKVDLNTLFDSCYVDVFNEIKKEFKRVHNEPRSIGNSPHLWSDLRSMVDRKISFSKPYRVYSI